MAVHVGDRGTTASPLQPQGIVHVNGERLDARAEFGPIEPGCDIIVITGDHMGVIVRRFDPTAPPTLPDLGRKLCTSFDERVAEENERTEAERQADLYHHRRTGTLTAVVVGTAAAATTLWLLWPTVTEQTGSPWAVAVLVVFGGAALGAGFFRALDEALGQVDPNFRGVTTASTVLAILGLSGGAILAVPSLGLVVGLLIGLGAAIVLAAVPVVFILLTGGAGEG